MTTYNLDKMSETDDIEELVDYFRVKEKGLHIEISDRSIRDVCREIEDRIGRINYVHYFIVYKNRFKDTTKIKIINNPLGVFYKVEMYVFTPENCCKWNELNMLALRSERTIMKLEGI